MLSLDIINIIIIKTGDLSVAISTFPTSAYKIYNKDSWNWAAKNGHLDVVKWLHTNRIEGCSTDAMDWAAQNGHLDVVKWLHENRTEGCSNCATCTINLAANNGHHDVAKWLYEHRIAVADPFDILPNTTYSSKYLFNLLRIEPLSTDNISGTNFGLTSAVLISIAVSLFCVGVFVFDVLK